MKRLAVLGSGNGSNFQAIVEYFQNYDLEITCISDKKNSYILQRAKNFGIKGQHADLDELYNIIKTEKFDLIALAGYMRILPSKILKLNRFVNVHPSLLPAFKGVNAIKQAYDYGVKITGVTIHRVTEELDSGPILAQLPVHIEPDMDINELENAIHTVEHKLYPIVIENLLYNTAVEPHLIMLSNNPRGCSGCH